MTLRVVARHASVWNFGGSDPAQFKQKQSVLRRHCEAIGRDFSEITLSIQSTVFPNDVQRTTDTVQALVDAGATHLILNLRPPIPNGIVARLAEEVIPKISG